MKILAQRGGRVVASLLLALALHSHASATDLAPEEDVRPSAARSPSIRAARTVVAGQPLAEALRRFALKSGYDVVFAEELVRDHRAGPVSAARSPYEELVQMLAGTGLAPRFTRRDAFIVEPQQAPQAADLVLQQVDILASPFASGDDAYRWYGEKLLQSILGLLRRSGELGTRSYDFTLYVWLSDEGRVVDLSGYEVTRDEGALTLAKPMLTGLFVGTPPPSNMPQPVVLRIIAQ
ncbi:hypothetical protein L6Q21_00400 [Sandaracinobacter sp. RS1-74]|uniref:hypothetical protein n=1 Tax=Sandaracinobacteroides sayramensis TaxID=2913411 RepID=UPI001EDAFD6E|nr:hypothetical protein [Sandaracinobacteroides sayramensis]MCG2839435.1 hypothetical protein [Sandaracinobacteroides sayramensis]